MFFLRRSPAAYPLLPAVPSPSAAAEPFPAPPKAMPWSTGCSGSRGKCRAHRFVHDHAVRAAKAEFCCREVVFLITNLGAATRVNIVGSCICILVVLSHWPLYEPLYPWHLKLVVFSLSPELSLGWTLLAKHFFELKSQFKGRSFFEVSCDVRAPWISPDRVCKCSSSWGNSIRAPGPLEHLNAGLWYTARHMLRDLLSIQLLKWYFRPGGQ